MPRALIVGGTGPIGRAAARRLLAAGWQVDLIGRDPDHMPAEIAAAGGSSQQTAATPTAGRRARRRRRSARRLHLLHGRRRCEAPAAGTERRLDRDDLEQGGVPDAAGNHSNSATAPDFGGPIRETQPTVPPSGADYTTREGYGANKVAAEQVLLDSGLPVTVLRPSKVHGAGALRPREWIFVKRVLDRRPAVFLAHRGADVDHPTAAANIAALIETVAAAPGRRVVNSADHAAPSGLEIARTIARLLGHVWDEILLDDGSEPLGRHPGTRCRRSCSTRPQPRSSATHRWATMRPRSPTRSSDSSPQPAAARVRSGCPVPTIRSSGRCSTTRPRTGISPAERYADWDEARTIRWPRSMSSSTFRKPQMLHLRRSNSGLATRRRSSSGVRDRPIHCTESPGPPHCGQSLSA
jgi:nucleoside-diphosphate-sugar epimerase